MNYRYLEICLDNKEQATDLAESLEEQGVILLLVREVDYGFLEDAYFIINYKE